MTLFVYMQYKLKKYIKQALIMCENQRKFCLWFWRCLCQKERNLFTEVFKKKKKKKRPPRKLRTFISRSCLCSTRMTGPSTLVSFFMPIGASAPFCLYLQACLPREKVHFGAMRRNYCRELTLAFRDAIWKLLFRRGTNLFP